MELFKYHKIKIKHSNKVLDIKGDAMSCNSEIVQHRDKSRDCEDQKFIIFTLDDGYMIFASKQSGKVLGIYKNQQTDETKLVIQDYSGSNSQRFFLLTDRITWPCLRVKSGNKFLEVIKSNIGDGAAIVQNSYSGKDNQRFTFVAEDNMPYPILEHLNSDIENSVLNCKSTITKEVLIPYLGIKDSIPADIQAKTTPYYKISKYQYWKKLYEHHFDGNSHESKKITYSTGLKPEINSKFTDITGISVMDDYNLQFKGFNNDIRNTIKQCLQVNESSSDKVIDYKTDSILISYPKGSPCTITEWVRVDRYTIERANGNSIGTFEIVMGNDTVRDYNCTTNNNHKYQHNNTVSGQV